VHGDRIEALACALVCATNYVRSAHVEGGEVSGTIDEVFRHCNSKLATHHFVSSADAANRVMALGEPKESIHVIGSPELDFHSQPSGVDIAAVKARYGIPFDDFGICVFHPVTSEADTMGAQARALFGALEASGRNFVVIAPNNDPGSDAIFRAIEALPKARFRLIPSMRFSHFSELMKNAAVMVGNSSAGVREAPFLGLPSLDIGTRQTNRATAPSLFASAADDRPAIDAFLRGQWGQAHDSHRAFGEGRASTVAAIEPELLAFAETYSDLINWIQANSESFGIASVRSAAMGKLANTLVALRSALLRNATGVFGDVSIRNSAITLTDFIRLVATRHPEGYAEMKQFLPGDYRFQDAIVGIVVEPISGANSDIAVLQAKTTTDVQDLHDRGSASISTAGLTINLNRVYTVPPEIQVTVTAGASLAIPQVTTITTTSFFVRLYQASNPANPVAGSISWSAIGY
jgi:UDP-N-acetylglucosamine 2-epimerase (hydrolysing)